MTIFGFISFGQTNISYNSEIKSYLDDLTQEEFSGTILVAKNDTIIHRRAYGLASIEYNVKNKIDTKFNIASITKMITSVAVLQLFQKGEIDLHRPIGIYLSDYPNKALRDSVTIHQLLTHTSGTKAFYGDQYLKTDKIRYRSVEDYVPLFVNDTLLFNPGSRYHYNGSGFVILGLIIEKISGHSYFDYLDQNIFKPSKMDNTIAIEVDSIVPNKASGYTSFFGESDHLTRNDYYISKASPAGGYYSTVDDLFNFSKALRDYHLLNKETTDLMFEPKVKGYNTHLGYGVDVDQRYNQIILGHSGGWYGVRCELMDFMDSHYTVVVLSNQDDNGKSGASKVIDFFKSLIADKKPEKLRDITKNSYEKP